MILSDNWQDGLGSCLGPAFILETKVEYQNATASTADFYNI
jgi:hypothetical protein